MKIQINNNQQIRRPNSRKIKELLTFLAQKTGILEGYSGYDEFSVLFTDDSGIRQVNQQLLNCAETTDVICHGYDPIPGEKKRTAEIIVNVEKAILEASRNTKIEESREIALYLAHACNHLSGRDDKTPAQRNSMRKRELSWLRQADSRKLLAGLIGKN